MTYHLLGGCDELVAKWAGMKFGKPFLGPFTAHGVLDETNTIQGAAIWNDFQGSNIELSYIGPLTRSIMRDLARYAFDINNVERVSLKTRSDNPTAKRLLSNKRHGFEFEGVRKRYYGTANALCFVIFREGAQRWIR